MHIREARPDDIPTIVDMGCLFVSTSRYSQHLEADPVRLYQTTQMLIDTPDRVMFVAERQGEIVGMLGALVTPHHISGDQFASEMCWWVQPEHRGSMAGSKLMLTFEAWARDLGATLLGVVAPDDAVGAMYARLGYRPLEMAWVKRIGLAREVLHGA